MARRRRLSLQVRLVIVLLIISLVPLAVSAFLIQRMAEVAQNFASNDAASLRGPLERAEHSFADLIEAKKELFREVAMRIAADPEISEGTELERRLGELVALSGDLLAIEVLEAGTVVGSIRRDTPSRHGLTNFREVEVEQRVRETDRVVRARFAADLTIVEDLAAVRQAIKLSKRVDVVREALPSGYVGAFLALVGGVVVVVTIFGIIVARRLTRRIDTLLAATRQLAGGDLDARVEIPGRDELAELAGAFNTMVDDLRSDRQQILYLQRIGAWQDVARRLAHEIKNPLTPIQLAMQQVVSTYQGDDERFAKLLKEADEIVREEISGLRRLVDAFSALGRLPRPDAKPLDLGVVVEDLKKDPVFASQFTAKAPQAPVMVGGDRLLLRRLVANLLENGIDAGAGKEVVLEWRGDSARGVAVMTVDDAGPGIEPAEAERLFEPYVTSKETGTGLGLAISKKIAIEHRGTLEISASPSPLGGARMILTIPLEKIS